MDRAGLPADWRAVWCAWNGLAAWPTDLPPLAPVAAQARSWREQLLRQPDLLTQLQGFLGVSS